MPRGKSLATRHKNTRKIESIKNWNNNVISEFHFFECVTTIAKNWGYGPFVAKRGPDFNVCEL